MLSRSGQVMIVLSAAISLLGVCAANAIVRRHDVPDAKYLVPDDYYPPLADIPIEGAGVLIGPRWVVTAAHATQWQREPIKSVTIGGKIRAVDQVIVHPGWKRAPQNEEADEPSRLATRVNNDDIALLRLAEPVTDVKPASLYEGSDEAGRVVEIIGRGQTGNGRDGVADNVPHRTALHRAQNRIDDANGRWLEYTFDAGPHALPLEGIFGGGDSGGPAIIRDHGVWKLAGLTSWGWSRGHIAVGDAAGRYGETARLVRISNYVSWIRVAIRDNS